MGGIGVWQLLIVLLIIVLIFGTKKLRSMGGDLGSAVKGFKKAVSDKDADFEDHKKVEAAADIDGTAHAESKKADKTDA